MQKNSCDIIIPVWNALNVTVRCVDSILKNTNYPYKLIVIDNGSNRETADYLTGLRNKPGLQIELVRNEKNLGFVKAINQGMRLSVAPYLCLMNNDTMAANGWLEEIVKVADSRADIGIVNPSSNTFGQYAGDESIEEYAAGLKRFTGQAQGLHTARGFCMLIKRAVIEKIGLFDESFGMGYFEETDFSCRAHKVGFSIVRAKGAYVCHEENISFKELKDNKTIFAANEKIFFERWGRPVRIGYFTDKAASKERIGIIAGQMAAAGHQIYIFIKKGLDWPVTSDHINVRKVNLGPVFFGLESIYSVFKRKRKKRLEILITDNEFLGKVLRVLRRLHGSEVMVKPRVDSLSQLAANLSKVY
jgi:GT2 family glycosyltransferase